MTGGRWRPADEWAAFVLALQFLTRLPLDTTALYSEPRMAASLRHYPLVGLLVGVVAATVWLLAERLWGDPLAAALLATSATVILTGALHEDGLADTCDGIGGGLTRARSLEIMRDSRLGTYGAVGLGLVLALRVVVLAGLAQAGGAAGGLLVPAALVAGQALSRVSAVLTVATSRYVRDEGTGKPVARAAGPATVTVTALLALLVLAAFAGVLAAALAGAGAPAGAGTAGLAAATGATGAAGSGVVARTLPGVTDAAGAALAAAAGALAGHLLARAFFERKLGGYTGDCLGCVQQLSELGLYLGLLAVTP